MVTENDDYFFKIVLNSNSLALLKCLLLWVQYCAWACSDFLALDILNHIR